MAASGPLTRAGGYAEERYKRGLNSWRRTVNRILAIVCAPLIGIGLTVLAMDRQGMSWAAGAVCGAAVMMWLMLRETPPRYVEQWHDGAEGERKTEKALKPLEKAGWTVVHDVQQRYGNYDHILVGPPGVYLLETKNLQGVVEIADGVPRLQRRHDPEARGTIREIRRQALAEAAGAKEAIQQRTGHRLWVHAVVVLWSEFPEQLLEADRCVYIHGSQLTEWLSNRPATLNPPQVGEISEALHELASEETLR